MITRARVGSMWASAITGALAGLVAGAVTGGLLADQDAMAGAGLAARGAQSGFALYLIVSVLLGAVFGAVVGFERAATAADVSGGLIFGLLRFVLLPLTLVPLLAGHRVRWSVDELASAFPELVASLGYGALTAVVFHGVSRWHAARSPTDETPLAPAEPRRVVILGGGFGGVGTAQRLEQLCARSADVEITLISSSNYLLFTPMLAEVASSSLRAEHISVPIRASCPRTRFRRADVVSVDADLRHVLVGRDDGTDETLPYDHLVVALGSVPSFRGLPGLEEHAFTLKTLEDANRVRNHTLRLLERADVETGAAMRRELLTFVVAGGGFAGTEMIAELFDLVHGVLHYYPGVSQSDARFVLVHSGERILPELDARLGDYAKARLEARGIEFVLGVRLAGATARTVCLAGDVEIPTRTLVWTAGNRPSPILDRLPFERGATGGVVADRCLRVDGQDRVWALGDCATVPDPARDGAPCPPTAQHALRQGKLVADNIARVWRGQKPEEFRYRSLGILVALGHRTAVAEIGGIRFSGFAAWLLWRSIYLAKLPGIERKLRVSADWFMDLVFSRDIVVTSSAPAIAQPSVGETATSLAPTPGETTADNGP